MPTRRRLLAFGAAAVASPNFFESPASAETWPARPVHFIVPLAAGGPTDSAARLLAEQLSRIWGQQVVTDNRPGAGTNIGNEFVAHAEPDGYTALYGTASLAVNATLYHTLGYDPQTDLAPVSLVAKFPFFMFVPNSSPARSVPEFIAYAKSKPGKLIMGSPGTGSTPHLAGELFQQMAQIKMTHAPYRGAAPAFVDLIPGRIDCYFGSGELLDASRAGQVRALATTGTSRAAAAPELPPIADSVSGYAVDSWQGVFVPAMTAAKTIARMSEDITAALKAPAIGDTLGRWAYTAQGSSPGDLREFLKRDAEKWTAVIKNAGLSID